MRRALLAMLLCAALSACDPGDEAGVAVGTLERDRIEIPAESWETLVELRVAEGERLSRGQVIARQDDQRAAARLAQAEAAAEMARRRLAELERGPRAEDIAEGRARLRGANSQLETDIREHARVADLVEKGLLSDSALDQAQARRDGARAARDEARARLDAMLEGTTIEELDQARAALLEAEALVADQRLTRERLVIRATRDGVVDALPFEAGDRPPAGATVAVLLADGPPYARVYVPAAIRPGVRPGSSARVVVDGVAADFAGRVRTVATEAAFTPYFALTERDRGRLSYLAEVELLDAAAADLPAGLPLEVHFETGRAGGE